MTSDSDVIRLLNDSLNGQQAKIDQRTKDVIVKKYMQEITLTIYPDGSEYQTVRMWSIGKGIKKPSKKKQRVQTNDTEIDEEEVY